MKDFFSIEPPSVVFPPTYVHSSSKMSIKVNNLSDSIISFEFRRCESVSQEIAILKSFDLSDPIQRQNSNGALLFSSGTFEFEPIKFDVWPHRYQQIVVTFKPSISHANEQETCYLTSLSPQFRIPLTISGRSLPPEAHFDYDIINVGHVLLGESYDYNVTLHNTGQVDLDYIFTSVDTTPLEFKFTPDHGHIPIGHSQPMQIHFIASQVGQFSFTFQFPILGVGATPPSITLHGRVIGPSYTVSVRELEFGPVSLGFLYSKSFSIENTSDIPLQYSLHFLKNEAFDMREISVSPEVGFIDKFTVQTFKVDLVPTVVKQYSMNLVFETPFADQRKAVLPISASCHCPHIDMENSQTNLGVVYIGYPYKFDIIANNSTPYSAKFEFEDPFPTMDASLEYEKTSGVVQPSGKSKFPCTFVANQLGHLIIRKVMKILQSDSINFSVEGDCSGAKLDFSAKSIEFGGVKVLEKSSKNLTITNSSPISAKFSIAFEGAEGIFSASPKEGEFPPNSETTIEISALLNDTLLFEGQMTFTIQHISPIVVKLSAKGVGNSIVPSVDMAAIDFGTVFINQRYSKSVAFSNHGRRAQEIKWSHIKGKQDMDTDLQIEPETLTIQPNENGTFIVSILSTKPIEYSARTKCEASIAKRRFPIYEPRVAATFLSPLIKFEMPKMEFVYRHDASLEENAGQNDGRPHKELMDPINIANCLSNLSKLPMDVKAGVSWPFSIDPISFSLLSGQSQKVIVTFHPEADTFQSKELEGLLNFFINNSEVCHTVQLKASLLFPNISFSSKSIDFGTVMSGTEKTQKIVLTNSGGVDASFQWQIATCDKRTFDVFPIRGTLKPHESMEAFFTFSSSLKGEIRNLSHQSKAICHLIGGPDYPMQIKGESAKIVCDVEPRVLDFGIQNFADKITKTFNIVNNSPASIRFQIKVPSASAMFIAEPISGTIEKDSHFPITITITTGFPQDVRDVISIYMGEFTELKVDVIASCAVPQIQFPSSMKQEVPQVSEAKLVQIEKEKMIEFLKSSHSEKEVLVASSYAIDFGDAYMGLPKAIDFEAKSIVRFPLSFEINTSDLSDSGFIISSVGHVEPEANFKVNISFDGSKRKKENSGAEEHQFSIKIADGIVYLIRIKANVICPALILSKAHLEFETTVVGQRRSSTFQIHNNSPVSMNFEFGSTQNIGILKQKVKEADVFLVSPSSGTLPPSSYVCIEVVFVPQASKSYSMQIPVLGSYSSQSQFLTLKGIGTQLKVEFSPPELVFPVSQPFSPLVTLRAVMKNPTQYPIEVYSTQYDFQLLVNRIIKAQNDESSDAEVKETVVERLRQVIIVHGPRKSGKTALSKEISEYFGLPVLNIKKVYDIGADQFKSNLQKAIDSYEYGFVVDGLDGIPESPETDQFLSSTMKHKASLDALYRNPTTVFPHPQPTSYEIVLSTLIDCLSGHYLFIISLMATEVVLLSHQNIEDEKKKERIQIQREEELRTLQMMTEEEYQKLTPAQMEEVDIRRKRAKTATPRPRSDEKDLIRKSRRARTSRPSILPTDPVGISLALFTFTLGSISEMVKESPKFKTLESYIQKNSQILLVDASNQIEKVMADIKTAIPTIADIRKEIISAESAPSLSINVPKEALDLEEPPSDFSLVITDPPEEWPTLDRNPAPKPKKGKKTQSEKKDEDIFGDYDLTKYTKRWKLGPGEETDLSVQFSGNAVKNYSGCLRFRIVDGIDEIFALPLSASCSLPSISEDIRKIFPKVIPKLLLKSEFVYAENPGEFHFGPCLILKEKPGKHNQIAYKQQISIVNESPFVADLTIRSSEPKSPWFIDQTAIKIPPDSSQKVFVGFHPTSPEKYRSILSFYVKDNPQPFYLTFVGEGCAPTVDMSQSLLDFERLLLGHSKTLKFTLKNPGKLPAFWKIKASSIGPNFQFSDSEGLLNPKSEKEITVVFTSPKPVSVKKTAQIDIFDAQKTRIFNSMHLSVLAEAFDVNFDLLFPKGMESLEFGPTKISQPKSLQCSLKNKGKFPMMFKVLPLKKAFASLMTISPIEGTVPTGDKTVLITFTFCSDEPTSYSDFALLRISDSVTSSVIDTIKVNFSAEVVRSSYEITPEILDFGPIPINVQSTKTFQIHNRGVFPFDFEIKSIGDQKQRRKSVAPRPKRKTTISYFMVGDFTFSRSFGTVNPGSSMDVSVDALPQKEGIQTQTVDIKISDSSTAEDVNYVLSERSMFPGLEAGDIEKILPSLRLCLESDLANFESNSFLEDKKTIHFSPLVVNSSSSIDVCLINPFEVPCTVDVSVKPKTKSNEFPFSLSVNTAEIPPNSSSLVHLLFSPKSSDHFFGSFEALVRGVDSDPSKNLRFAVEGAGTIPNLVLKVQNERSSSSYSFGKTLVGHQKSKVMSLTNTSLVIAKFTVKATQSPDFELVGFEDSGVYSIQPGQSRSFRVNFCPEKVRHSQFEVSAEVLDGEEVKIVCTGEGFQDDVMLEGLEDDILTFPDSAIGRTQKVSFYINNVSEKDVRFNWSSVGQFTFQPQVGHLHRKSQKLITATFTAERPVKIASQKAVCQVQRISLESGSSDWDDSMKVVSFAYLPVEGEVHPPEEARSRLSARQTLVRKSRIKEQVETKLAMSKVIEVKPEPKYSIEEKLSDIIIKVNAVADVIKYALSASDLVFSSTMMFDTRIASTKLVNSSNIRIEYEWKCIESNSDDAFKIEPIRGEVEPGKNIEFKVSFCPKEVDEFKSKYRCEIPYSVLPLPELSLSGVSKRPICHFGLITSDYLTRRHPDYTNVLPDDIRVIEINSAAVRKPVTKGFTITNTTASAYEMCWKMIAGPKGDVISVDPPVGVISSGRSYSVSFTYNPVSLKTVESQWEFCVPSHDLKLQFLVVGRIQP